MSEDRDNSRGSIAAVDIDLEIAQINSDTSVTSFRGSSFDLTSITTTIIESDGDKFIRSVGFSETSANTLRVFSGNGNAIAGMFFAPYDAESVVEVQVVPQVRTAITEAVIRANTEGLTLTEANQLNNLRAYIANHSGDGVLDAREQNIITERANNIAPEKAR